MMIRNMLPQLWGDDVHSLASLRREMDYLFENWTKDIGVPQNIWSALGAWPRVNISETDKELRITAELPGVEQKDIDITLTGGDLVIKGEKKSESEEKKDDKGRSYHRAERSFGSFARRMALPFEVEAGKIDATFKDGVLTLVLPKPAEAQKASRKIEIKSEKAIEPRKAA